MPVSAPAGDKKVLRASVLHYDPEPSSNDVQDAAEPFPEGTARVVMLRRLARATQAPTAPWVDLDLALHAAVVREELGGGTAVLPPSSSARAARSSSWWCQALASLYYGYRGSW